VKRILCLNSGSSSLKITLQAGEEAQARGVVESIGASGGRLMLRAGEAAIERAVEAADHAAALRLLLAEFDALELRPTALAHRLVHGGPKRHEPTLLDAPLLAELRAWVRFAPLHLPSALSVIDEAGRHYPGLPQVACFDTHFHWGLPEVARRLPLPLSLHEAGVRRYGFHGLSYEYVVSALGGRQLGRAVIAHLGSGASLAAVDQGRPIDTTMAFTPESGVVMGTRTGDLDPGVLFFLLAQGRSAAEVERLLTKESGLLGVSGSSSGMRELLQRRQGDARAALAVEIFCWSCRKAVGALAAALGGLETLVFTGGIGERAAPVRAEICAGLGHLGVVLDPARNSAGSAIISADASRCKVRVVQTDEDAVIARHAGRLLKSAIGPGD